MELNTRYAVTPDGVYIGHQTTGEGPVDVVWQPDWPGNIDMEWEFPVLRSFLAGLASFSRLIRHDHRGVGLSSRNVLLPNLETRVSDLLLVLDAVGASRPVFVGTGASGAVHALLAATRPDRVSAMVWLDGEARYARAPDYPWGRTAEELEAELVDLGSWGTEEYGPMLAEDQAEVGNVIPESDIPVFSKASRNACTPDVAIELARMWAETDVREVLPAIQVPTLVGALTMLGQVERARDIASRIPGAEFLEVPDGGFTQQTAARYVEAIRRFAGATHAPLDLDTVLATVLFTDIVGSTERQAVLGDRGWQDLIERHNAIVREALDRWHGTELDTAGDGFYATFEGPARAIRCAHDVVDGVRTLGVEVRAGVHTGECRLIE
ncbi:MAG: alpha/beta fold hydrolase, partial [Actinomycetota bacterium]|nr:alpha/beta fold hydrolase [Actinomycetota bacterium]